MPTENFVVKRKSLAAQETKLVLDSDSNRFSSRSSLVAATPQVNSACNFNLLKHVVVKLSQDRGQYFYSMYLFYIVKNITSSCVHNSAQIDLWLIFRSALWRTFCNKYPKTWLTILRDANRAMQYRLRHLSNNHQRRLLSQDNKSFTRSAFDIDCQR